MTSSAGVAVGAPRGFARRLAAAVVDRRADARSLAAFRIVLGTFTLGYLATRVPVHLGLRGRSGAGLEPVGVLTPLDSPLPDGVVVALVVAGLASSAALAVGFAHRVSGPLAAAVVLVLATYRSSWGQLLHFEHLIVLHLLVVALSPAADAWSVDSRRRGRAARPERPATAYGWPLGLASMVTVATYVIAGIAKLRIGGAGWVLGDALRNHVAYSAARLDVLGAAPPLLAGPLVRVPALLAVAAAVTVVLELSAPVALVSRRFRDGWVAATWAMHVGVLASMHVGFPMPLLGVAFVPLFDLDRGWSAVAGRAGRWRNRRRP